MGVQLGIAIIWLVFSLAASVAVRAQPVFDVAVPSALLMDADTGQILFEKDPRRPVPPASLAKVMTLLIAMDHVKAGRAGLDDPVRVSVEASRMTGSRVYLHAGEVQSLEQLLKAVAIAGANDAAVAVAEFIAGSESAFVGMMNERAHELGMADSRFANAHGLPPAEWEGEAKTTALDIAKAARALITFHPEVLEWTRSRIERFRDEPLFNLYNTNDLVGKYEGLDGLRTGMIEESGWLLVATARRGDLRLISVVMEARDEQERQSVTMSLLDYGFHRFVPVTLAAGQVGEVRLAAGTPEKVPVEVRGPVRLLVPRGSQAEVTTEIQERSDLALPVMAGAVVGEYVIRHAEGEALRLPLHAAARRRIGRAFGAVLWRRLRDFAASLFGRGG